MTEIVLGIRLKADGSDLVGTVKVSEDALKKLREEAGRNTSEAAKLSAEHQNMARTMSDNANKIGAYSAGWTVLTSAIISAAGAAKDYIKESAMLAARHETLGVVMAVIGRNAGYSAAEMNTFAEGVRKSGITMNESREVVIKLAQANIDLSLSSKLARAAQDAAVIGNINSTEALSRMTHGIVSGQTDVLRGIGINVSFEDSYKKLAKQLGVTVEQLSEQEKVQARANEVLEYSVRLQGAYEASLTTAGKQINSLKRYEEDLKTLRGEVWNEALIILVEKYTESLKGANDEARQMAKDGSLKAWGNDVVDTLAFVGDALSAVNVGFKLAVGGMTTMIAAADTGYKIAGAWMGSGKGMVWNRDEIPQLIKDFKVVAGAEGEKERLLLMRQGFRDQVAQRRAEAARAAPGQAEIDDADRGPTQALAARPEGPRATGGAGAKRGGADGAGNFYRSAMRGFENSIDKLTDGELTEYDKLMRSLVDTGMRFTKVQVENMEAGARKTDALIHEKNELKELQAELDRAAKLKSEAEAIAAKYNDSILRAGDAIDKEIESIKFETTLIGLNNAARERAIALRNQEAKSGLLSDGAREQNRERLEEALSANAAAKEADAAIKKASDESKRLIDDTGRGITDAIMRGGADGWKSLRDTFINGFKNMILRPIIQPIITSAAGSVLGALGVAGNAGASGGGGGAGGLGNMFSMASNANSLLGGGGIGAGIFGSAAAYSTALGLSSAAVGSQAAMLAAQTGVFGAAGLGATASAAGATGAAGAMAAIPYIGWAVAAIAAISALSGKGKGGPASTTASILSGTASQAGLDGMFYGTAQNSKRSFQWPNQGAFDRDAPVFNAEIKKAYAAMDEMGKLLGVNTSLLAGATAQINWRIPVNEVVTAANLAPQMGQLTDQLALQMIPSLTKFARANETATQTLLRMVEVQAQLKAREAQITATIPGFRRDVSGRLGIGTLTDYQNSLATSEYRSPMDRFGAAQDQLSSTYSRAMGGDLAAVNAFPQQLQQALGIGRDVFASGPEFQRLFVEGNRRLNELLSTQQNLQNEMFAELPITITETSQNEIAEMRMQTKAIVAELTAVKDELRLMREAA